MNRPDARLVMRLRAGTGYGVLLCQKMLEQLPEEHRERYVSFHEREYPTYLHDPIEADPNYAEILLEVNAKAQEALENSWKMESEQQDVEIDPIEKILRRRLGDCFWSTKKRLLKETYGIDWKTPDELMYLLRS